MTKRFQQAMELMRRRDPQLREDGFHFLLPHAAEHVDELIAAARAPEALPVLHRTTRR